MEVLELWKLLFTDLPGLRELKLLRLRVLSESKSSILSETGQFFSGTSKL